MCIDVVPSDIFPRVFKRTINIPVYSWTDEYQIHLNFLCLLSGQRASRSETDGAGSRSLRVVFGHCSVFTHLSVSE